MNRRLTVVGARGFIGGVLAKSAAATGWDVLECSHSDVPDVPLGTVAYVSGVAWGAQRQPLEAYRLHAGAVLRIVERCNWDRILYVSSTRVYDRSQGTSEEDFCGVVTSDAADVYAASKLAGEGIVLSAAPQNRVVRCSNVFGASIRSGLFLSDILRQATTTGRIELRSSRESSKDYVSVNDVAAVILTIAVESKFSTYNVAAGRNTTHQAILDAIAAELEVEICVAPDAPVVTAAPIDVSRIAREFPFVPAGVVESMPDLVRAFRAAVP